MSKIQTSKLREQLTSEVDSLLERLYTSNDEYVALTLKEFEVKDLMELGEALDSEVNILCSTINKLDESEQIEFLDEDMKSVAANVGGKVSHAANVLKLAAKNTAMDAKSKAIAAAKYVKGKAKYAVQFSKDHPAAAAVIGGAVLAAMGATALYMYLNRSSKKWAKAMQQLNKAKTSGNKEKVADITKQLRAIKTNMSKADAELKKKFEAMTPEKKAEFTKKKGEMLASMKERENLK